MRISHYWPPLGGTNCAVERGGRCVSKVSGCKDEGQWPNEEHWCVHSRDWNWLSAHGAAACPAWMPFGTEVRVLDRTFVCVDRGGAIEGNWVDLMLPVAPVSYGAEAKARIVVP